MINGMYLIPQYLYLTNVSLIDAEVELRYQAGDRDSLHQQDACKLALSKCLPMSETRLHKSYKQQDLQVLSHFPWYQKGQGSSVPWNPSSACRDSHKDKQLELRRKRFVLSGDVVEKQRPSRPDFDSMLSNLLEIPGLKLPSHNLCRALQKVPWMRQPHHAFPSVHRLTASKLLKGQALRRRRYLTTCQPRRKKVCQCLSKYWRHIVVT